MSIILIALFFCYVITRDRLYVPIAIIQRDYPLLEMPFIVCTAAFALSRHRIVLNAVKNRVSMAWVPYFALGVFLPICGIVFGEYTVTSLYAIVIVVLAPVCALLLGASVYYGGVTKRDSVINWCINVSLSIQTVLSVLQFLRLLGFSNALVDWVTAWDIAAQMRVKEEYVLIGRSVGTYINPNVLGVWAVIAFFWNLMHGKGVLRFCFCSMAAITLLLSQSRGSAFAFFVGLFVYLGLMIRTDKVVTRGGLTAIAVASFATVLGAVVIAFYVPSWSFLPGGDRWKDGASVVTQGAEADANFAARFHVWREAISFLSDYPLGTWGPPQVAFVLPPDNLFVYTLLQGSLIYIVSLLLALVVTAHLILKSDKKLAALTGLLAIAMGANSISALPLLYSPGLLLWFFLGCYISERSEEDCQKRFIPVGREMNTVGGRKP